MENKVIINGWKSEFRKKSVELLLFLMILFGIQIFFVIFADKFIFFIEFKT